MDHLINFFTKLTEWHWFGFASILVILEVLLGTSFFLLWLGVSAATIGLILLLIPTLAWETQLLIFAGEAVICLLYWYLRYKNNHTGADQLNLNRRNQQFVGRTVTLSEPLVNGRGRIQIDDSYWRVEGPDLPAGTAVKVVGVDGVVLKIEKL